MNLAEIRAGLADRLGTVPGLRPSAFPPDSLVLPMAIVQDPEEGTYHTDFSEGVALTIPVLLLVGRMVDRSANDALNGYLSSDGPESVKAAIEAEPTLGGSAEYTTVTGFRRFQWSPDGEPQLWLSVEVVCEVISA